MVNPFYYCEALYDVHRTGARTVCDSHYYCPAAAHTTGGSYTYYRRAYLSEQTH
jgi:hypothetical protein